MLKMFLILTVLSLIGVSSFALMVGITGSALSIGTELNPSTFIYGGIAPESIIGNTALALTVGGGMQLSTLTKIVNENTNMEIGYGIITSIGFFNTTISYNGIYGNIFGLGLYGGPALIFKARWPNIFNSKTLSYISFGLEYAYASASIYSQSQFEPTFAYGFFYVF